MVQFDFISQVARKAQLENESGYPKTKIFLYLRVSQCSPLYQFLNPMDQSQLRTTRLKAIIGPWDSKIGKKRAALFHLQPE